MKRIWVRGSTGAGKSTFARKLADKLGLPHIELDNLRFEPGWVEVSDAQFQRAVDALFESESGSVLDGNYQRFLQGRLGREIDTIIWLDYSFLRIGSQLFWRTCRRCFFGERCCNGNKERIWVHFTNQGLPYWLITTFGRRRKQCLGMLADPSLVHVRRVRFRRPAEAQFFLDTLEAHSASLAG